MQEQSRKLKRASEIDVNVNAPGQRFKTDGRTTTITVGEIKGMRKKRSKVCDVCGKPWESSIRIIFGKDGKRCVHNGSRGLMSEGDKAVSRMQGRLAPGEVAVKGGDGMVRIYG